MSECLLCLCLLLISGCTCVTRLARVCISSDNTPLHLLARQSKFANETKRNCSIWTWHVCKVMSWNILCVSTLSVKQTGGLHFSQNNFFYSEEAIFNHIQQLRTTTSLCGPLYVWRQCVTLCDVPGSVVLYLSYQFQCSWSITRASSKWRQLSCLPVHWRHWLY